MLLSSHIQTTVTVQQLQQLLLGGLVPLKLEWSKH